MRELSSGIGNSSTADEPDLFANMSQNAINAFQQNNNREYLGLPKSRPTRESVLKRLSEALMRRSLTKVSKLVASRAKPTAVVPLVERSLKYHWFSTDRSFTERTSGIRCQASQVCAFAKRTAVHSETGLQQLGRQRSKDVGHGDSCT